MSDQAQAQFNGWARVEVMGHQSHIGYVRTEAYGQAVMFRVDTPELPEREYTLTAPAYVSGAWTPAGATVKREAVRGCSVLVGAGSIYRILPCDEAAALSAIEESRRAELKVISLPESRALDRGIVFGNEFLPGVAYDSDEDYQRESSRVDDSDLDEDAHIGKAGTY